MDDNEQMPLEFNKEPEQQGIIPSVQEPVVTPPEKPQEPNSPEQVSRSESFDWSKINEKDECQRCGNEYKSEGSCQECDKNPEKLAYLENLKKENTPPLPKPPLKAGFVYHKHRPGQILDKKKNIYDSAYNLVELAPDDVMKQMIVRLAKSRPDWLEQDLSDLARIHLVFETQKKKAKADLKAKTKTKTKAKKKSTKTVKKQKKKSKR